MAKGDGPCPYSWDILEWISNINNAVSATSQYSRLLLRASGKSSSTSLPPSASWVHKNLSSMDFVLNRVLKRKQAAQRLPNEQK